MGWNHSRLKEHKERNVDGTIGKRTNENGTIKLEALVLERNDLAGGPRFRMERNDQAAGPRFITERNDIAGGPRFRTERYSWRPSF